MEMISKRERWRNRITVRVKVRQGIYRKLISMVMKILGKLLFMMKN